MLQDLSVNQGQIYVSLKRLSSKTQRTMSESFTPQISDRICRHMNDDHAEAVLLYAKVYGQVTMATAAAMVAIDAQGMDLLTQVEGTPTPTRVVFDHVLQNAEDAHHTLIEMVKQARQAGK